MGADYQEVLGRLHNEAMIGKFVRMFLQDDSFQILEEALRRGDVKEAFRGAHTLKGVCQNLGFSNLYGVVHNQPVLVSLNTKYSPILISPEQRFEIVGKVLN